MIYVAVITTPGEDESQYLLLNTSNSIRFAEQRFREYMNSEHGLFTPDTHLAVLSLKQFATVTPIDLQHKVLALRDFMNNSWHTGQIYNPYLTPENTVKPDTSAVVEANNTLPALSRALKARGHDFDFFKGPKELKEPKGLDTSAYVHSLRDNDKDKDIEKKHSEGATVANSPLPPDIPKPHKLTPRVLPQNGLLG